MPHYKSYRSRLDKLRIFIARAQYKTILLEKHYQSARSSGDVRSELWLTVDFRKRADDVFSHLKKAYLNWRREVRDSARACEVVGYVDDKSSEGEQRIRSLCELWNQDAELTALPPINFILVVEAGVWSWMGLTSSVAPVVPMDRQNSSTMRLFDFKQEHAQEMAAWETHWAEYGKKNEESLARELEAAKKKNAEKARNPMQVPKGVAGELAAYLRLEFGESWYPRSVKAYHLKFVGEYMIDGVTTQYWSFPTSAEPMWATVERFDNSYSLGMTSDPPPVGPRA
jgi:hypothetical protein